MKVRTIVGCLCIMGCLSLSSYSMAGDRDYQKAIPQGFGSLEDQTTETTVAGVFNNEFDGQLVSLEGRLIKYMGHEMYLFEDPSGQITVELDDDHEWSFLSKNALIRIVGVVERSFLSTKIDVKQAFVLDESQSPQG